MAPDLVQIQKHFGNDRVVFISLTPEGETAARRFIEGHHINWLSGWGAGETIERYLGTQYPMLVVVDRNGRIAWNDGAARLQHNERQCGPELFERLKAISRAE